MVYECFRKISECNKKEIPIIGIGGISNCHDVLEYILAGATATGIGTQWFINNTVFEEIHNDLKEYLHKHNETLENLIGKAHSQSWNNSYLQATNLIPVKAFHRFLSNQKKTGADFNQNVIIYSFLL